MEQNQDNNNFWQDLLVLLTNLAEEIAVQYYEPNLPPYNPNNDGGSYYDFSDRVAELKDLRGLGSDILELRNEIHSKLGNLLREKLKRVLQIIVAHAGNAQMVDFENSPAHKIFECLIAALLNGEVVGQSNDRGVDVRRRNENNELDLIVQCKAGNSYAGQVAHIFRELLGTCWLHRCSRALLAMTAEHVASQQNILAFGNNNNANYPLQVDLWDRTRIVQQIDSLTEFLAILRVWRNFLNILRRIPQLQQTVDQIALAIRKMADVIRKAYEVAEDYEAELSSRIAESKRQFEEDDTMSAWEKAYMRGVEGSSSDEEGDDFDEYNENQFNVYSDQEELDPSYESEDEELIEHFEGFNFNEQ